MKDKGYKGSQFVGSGKDENMKYMGSMKDSRLKDGMHASKVDYVDVDAAQKAMNKNLKVLPMDYRGNPRQAFDYNY